MGCTQMRIVVQLQVQLHAKTSSCDRTDNSSELVLCEIAICSINLLSKIPFFFPQIKICMKVSQTARRKEKLAARAAAEEARKEREKARRAAEARRKPSQASHSSESLD